MATDWFESVTGLRQDETEFGGKPGLRHPTEREYVPKEYEEHTRMMRTDESDPDSGSDIVSQRSA